MERFSSSKGKGNQMSEIRLATELAEIMRKYGETILSLTNEQERNRELELKVQDLEERNSALCKWLESAREEARQACSQVRPSQEVVNALAYGTPSIREKAATSKDRIQRTKMIRAEVTKLLGYCGLKEAKICSDHWDPKAFAESLVPEPSEPTRTRVEVYHSDDPLSGLPTPIPENFPDGFQKVATIETSDNLGELDQCDRAFCLTNHQIHHDWTTNPEVECVVQNPRSTSVGDVVVIGAKCFLCRDNGWKEFF
jgi:hypothetical protein